MWIKLFLFFLTNESLANIIVFYFPFFLLFKHFLSFWRFTSLTATLTSLVLSGSITTPLSEAHLGSASGLQRSSNGTFVAGTLVDLDCLDLGPVRRCVGITKKV